uniref:ATPase phospholipid transporting 10D n=1 Tax=Sander lucioperca TaxID=283035 RepID=A0A8C9ZUI1_SANLU
KWTTLDLFRWKDVRVGDFVHLSCNEIIPADMLLLYSSDPRGVCYIETANLDGETNLKQRQVVSDLPLQVIIHKVSLKLCLSFNVWLHPGGVRVGLHNNNLLLRSCTVRNTETVVGMVVYAGHETKAMLNNSGPRYKRSKLEKHLNTDILWCVLLLIIMCLTAAIGVYQHKFIKKMVRLVMTVFQDGASCKHEQTLSMSQQVLIPISLYVSIEIVKLGQIYFIHNDLALYNKQLDSRIQCRALNITEDLGQIQYLFSDKTGTLTENKMVFRRCSIYGVEYPHEENDPELVRKLNWFCSPELALSDGSSGTPSSLELTYITDFFLALAICNSVVVSSPKVDCESDTNEELLYEAESPDEAALVHAAQAYSCTLRGRSAEGLLVDLPGIGSLAVQLLHILPFDSNRKKMSVVVRHPLTGRVVVYTKGADSVIMDLEIYSHIREQTQIHLDGYAREGLRTLCIAKKLCTHIITHVLIGGVLVSCVCGVCLCVCSGTTGIVDRLQEEVPETIEALQRAGIKVWILTGDKKETAINIAYACKLLCPNDQLLTLKVEVQRSEASLTEPTAAGNHGESSSGSVAGFVLVIDGRTLDWALQEELKSHFLELSQGCKAVICCRSTPLQKSQGLQCMVEWKTTKKSLKFLNKNFRP